MRGMRTYGFMSGKSHQESSWLWSCWLRCELKGFKRVALEPGETKKVEIEVPVASLGYTLHGKYVVEPGEFEAWIAPNSDAGKKLTIAVRP